MLSTPLRKTLLAGTAYLVAFLFLAPYLQMLITALTPGDELRSIPANYLPSNFEFANFINVWNEAPLATYLKNSIIIALFSTALVMLVSLPAAYYTARYRYRGRILFMLLVLITQMFAPTALGATQSSVASSPRMPRTGRIRCTGPHSRRGSVPPTGCTS